MNQPEGYVLVQVKQLAQWREWANNVAAWSKQADRSSEVARLKSSISSAMISATLPPASAAWELTDEQAQRHALEAGGNDFLINGELRYCFRIAELKNLLTSALATKPQAGQEATPPAQTVQDSAKEFADWLLKHYLHTFIDKRNMDMFLRAFAARNRDDEVGK